MIDLYAQLYTQLYASTFVQNIFDPVVQFLNKAYGQLASLGTVSARGVRLDNYFGVFGVLGPSWSRLISSLIGSLVFLTILYAVQKYSRVLLWFKALIKWW